MGKYTDDEIRAMPKITAKIAADYLGISPMMVTLGMRNNVLPIGFAIKKEDRYSESWSYNIIPERLIAYNHGRINEVQVQNIEKNLNTIISQFEEMKRDLDFSIKRKRGIGGIKQFLAILADTESSKTQPLQIEERKAMVLDKQEVRAVMSSTTVRLTRKELYEEIWKISVAGVSKKIWYPICQMSGKDQGGPNPCSSLWILDQTQLRKICGTAASLWGWGCRR